MIEGKKLYVGSEKKKDESKKEIKSKFEKMKIERMKRYKGVKM